MDMCVYKKDYFKESHEVQSAITCAVSTLYERISMYENQNITFARIFNDDRVKYDKHGDFYTFKYQKSNLQLRILYAYIIIEGTPVIIVADFVVKRRTIRITLSNLNRRKHGIHMRFMDAQSA